MSSKYTDNELIAIYNNYSDMIYRICFTYLKDKHAAEDSTQDTFLRLIKSKKKISDAEHQKAWLIVTATNICKDYLKHWSRKNCSLEEYNDPGTEDINTSEVSDVLAAVLSLTPKERIVMYLFYYEGYSGSEISKMLDINESTVRNRIFRGKEDLKKKLGELKYE